MLFWHLSLLAVWHNGSYQRNSLHSLPVIPKGYKFKINAHTHNIKLYWKTLINYHCKQSIIIKKAITFHDKTKLNTIFFFIQSHPHTTRGNRQLSLTALAGRLAAWRGVTLPLLPNTRYVFQFSFRVIGHAQRRTFAKRWR